MDATELAAAIQKHSWYHFIELAPGVVTPGWAPGLPLQKPMLDEIRRTDLAGKRVLDVGCRDGLFSIEAERYGASYVLGIDNDVSRGAVEVALPWLGSKVEMRELNVYDLVVKDEDRFDVVLFPGVLYHLRLPFLGLKRIADALKPGGTLIIETCLMTSFPDCPLIYAPAPNENPWQDRSSVTFFNHLGLHGALTSYGFSQVEQKNLMPIFCGNGSSVPDIARALYTSQKSNLGLGEADALRDEYWYGTHRIHSTGLTTWDASPEQIRNSRSKTI